MRDKTLPAHPKWPNLAHSTHAGRVLTVLTTKKPAARILYRTRGRDRARRHNSTPGATGVEWKAPGDPQVPAPVPVDGLKAWRGFETRHRDHPTQISHIISLGHFSRPYENVAIPTIQLQYLNKVAGELRAKLLRRRQGPRQTNFACNSVRPNFNKPRKRCNSNDANSIFEQAAGELHAKLMIDSHNWATYSNPGPSRGAGGRRQGLAGQRADAPS